MYNDMHSKMYSKIYKSTVQQKDAALERAHQLQERWRKEQIYKYYVHGRPIFNHSIDVERVFSRYHYR